MSSTSSHHKKEPRKDPEWFHRGYYKYWMDIQTRWMDNDMYGHVNNVVYYSYFDTIVNHYLVHHCGLALPGTEAERKSSSEGRKGLMGVVAESGCVFRSSVEYPDIIQAGLSVSKLGSSSVTYRIGIFRKPQQYTPTTRTAPSPTPVWPHEQTAEIPGFGDTVEAASAAGHFVHVFVDPVTRRPGKMEDRMRRGLERLVVVHETDSQHKL
ncbi:Thioesterase/thiol ester dehydrase-isomerase [Gonapodya prolifera JEL478]|uniref:Thioesterase/thiol ester dehydrase-isomerase n=1 Tax=Gonapodya prolifera (strain JEL478) TaxID=1344416 RepID=A0A139A0N2_GONPJ|nr:Thioesterase/thiol ester dehydrase-isomerase [Gonapodya prolifera JEL478]|eukprot:KXS10330.1 Thioesterase/thiol ester dehydrase-isomerase [Gonapodya prolifera JEL478]